MVFLLHTLISSAYALTLTVEVVDNSTGKPLANSDITCLFEETENKSTTASNGRANIDCLHSNQLITVFHPDYGKKTIPYEQIGNSVFVRVRLESPFNIIIEDEKQTDAVTRHVLDAEELKRVPGTFGDPIRALQSLPGVARPNIAEGTIVVRGAEGINTGFYVDGMPVPYMFHTMVGRSVIIPSFIDDIEFYPGGMPSNYGEVTQAVVNVRTNTKPVEGTRVNMRVDFLDGGLAVEHRLHDKLIMRMAGRYSWVGGLISTASKLATMRYGGQGYEATYVAPQYWDSFGDIRWNPTLTDSISLLFMESRDMLYFHQSRFDADGDGEPDPLAWEDADLNYNPEHWIDNQFWRSRLMWTHKTEDYEGSTWIAGGTEQQQNLLGAWWIARQGPYRGRVGGPSLVFRHNSSFHQDQWGTGSTIVAGTQITTRWFTAEDFQDTFDVEDYSEIVQVTTEDRQFVSSAWVEPQWRTEKSYVGIGLRGAWYNWEEQSSFQPEPRMTLRYLLPNDQWLKASVGRYSQLPPLERYAQGIGNPNLGIMTAWQASVGTEYSFLDGLSIDSSLFSGWMNNLVVRNLEVDTYNDGNTVTTELQPYYLGVQGFAVGWEGLIRLRPDQRNWWGWVSMTLSKALRMDEYGNIFPSDYDQPISFTAVGAYDLGKDWEISGKVQATSGQPYTPLYGVYVPTDEYFTAIRGDLNSARYPYYFRVDTRVQKVWNRNWMDWTLYLDVYNATSRRNPFVATYNYDYSRLVDIISLPIIPTLGLEVNY